MKKLLNIDYACVQGTYWMVYGPICSFASVFLLARGYSNSEIGLILAVGNVLAVFMQPFAADLADRSKRLSLIGISEIMTVILIGMTAGLFIMQRKSVALMVIYILIVAWHTALQPLVNSLTFKLEDSGVPINFGIARSMGSLTYATVCALLGTLVERHGIIVLPVSEEIIMAALLISFTLTGHNYAKAKAVNNAGLYKTKIDNKESEEINLISFVRRNKMFFIVNIGVIGVYFSNAILNNFMIQIVSNVGGNSEDMGRIFSVMAFVEIPTMFCFNWLRKKFTCQAMLKVSSIGFALKIALCFVAKSVTMIFMAQFIQIFSLALFLPAMVHFINEIMSRGEAVKGQSLFTTMTTVTTVFASISGGIILDISGAKMLTLVATAATALGALLIICTVDKVGRNKGALPQAN